MGREKAVPRIVSRDECCRMRSDRMVFTSCSGQDSRRLKRSTEVLEDHSKRRPRLHNHQRDNQPRNTRREGKLYLVKFCLAAEMMEPRERLRFDALHAARALACLPFLPLDNDRKSWAIYLFREGHDQDQRQKEYPSIALQGLCSRHGSR